MKSVIDIGNVNTSIRKINLYRNEEIKQKNSILSRLDKMNVHCKIESSDILDKVQLELKDKFNTISQINENLAIILSKNVVKYRDTAIDIANKFANLG